MSLSILVILQIAIIAYALVGGVFLAFSDFIMRSLARSEDASGLRTMQTINREVFRWVFMTLFLGLAPISLIIAVAGMIFVGGASGGFMLAAGLIYVLGCFGVTVLFNVPMNEALAKMEARTDAARTYWTQTYLPRWTFWNSVRTVACVVSSGLLLLGLVLSLQP